MLAHGDAFFATVPHVFNWSFPTFVPETLLLLYGEFRYHAEPCSVLPTSCLGERDLTSSCMQVSD
jgi:hypothetical protein